MELQGGTLSPLLDHLVIDLLRFGLANGDVPLGSIGVELPPAEVALDVVAALICRCLLLHRQGFPAAGFEACPEGRTLLLPLGHLALLGRRRGLFGLVGSGGGGRRWWLFEVLHLRRALGGGVEGLALGLEDLLADLLVLGDHLHVELPSAPLGALRQLDLARLLLLVARHLLRRLHLPRVAATLRVLLRHLPLQQREEVLVCLQRNLLCLVDELALRRRPPYRSLVRNGSFGGNGRRFFSSEALAGDWRCFPDLFARGLFLDVFLRRFPDLLVLFLLVLRTVDGLLGGELFGRVLAFDGAVLLPADAVPAHLLLEQLQSAARLLDLAVGHVLLHLVGDLLRGARPRWQLLGGPRLDRVLGLPVVGVLEVFGGFGRDLGLVKPVLPGRLSGRRFVCVSGTYLCSDSSSLEQIQKLKTHFHFLIGHTHTKQPGSGLSLRFQESMIEDRKRISRSVSFDADEVFLAKPVVGGAVSDQKSYLPPYLFIIDFMKRRTKKQVNYESDAEGVPKAGLQLQQDFDQERPTQPRSRNPPAKSPKPTRPKKPAKSKSRDSISSSESQQNIIQFRHGDDVAKDHIIPSFMRRWDGESNELEITGVELGELTPMLQAYWRVKSGHMNTVVMVEVGREFMVLENDAIRMHEIFKKKLIKFSKFLMVYFWGKETELAKRTLFDMRIPVLIMTELDDPQFRAKHGMVRREITEVLTPALHLGYHDDRPRSRLLLSLFHAGGRLAAVVLDSESNQFFVEEAGEDDQLHELRRVLNKYRPVELLLLSGQRELSQVAKQICSPYISELQLKETSLRTLLSKFLLSNSSPLFKELQQNYNRQEEQFEHRGVVMALAMVWQHLETLSLLQKIFFQGIFHGLGEAMGVGCLIFDSQVYQNLQVFWARSGEEQSYGGKGSLMGFLDRCRTLHGRKLLHRWLDQPLLSRPAILQRQEAVRELLETPLLLVLHEKLEAYSRLEQRLGDIYHWVARSSEQGKLILTRGINYEKDYDLRRNPAVVKLTEIMAVLKLIKEYEQFLRSVAGFKLSSALLKKNTKLTDIEGIHNFSIEEIAALQCLPDISYVADIISRRVSYDELTGSLEPVAGQSEIYDEERRHVDRINSELQEELVKWQEYFASDKVCFVSVRARNEIQIPKTAIAKVPAHRDLIFSSEVANGIRYVTHETAQLSQELMEHERAIAEAYEPFLQEIVTHFCQYKFLWDSYVQAMAALDVLMALAQAARSMPLRCLPLFEEEGVEIVRGMHANLLGVKEELVPNSVALGGQERALLLTGPNMGGKSTFLKQVCTLAVLAQVGSYVPAAAYRAPIFDQIFCRMGASDRILEGKSTFYVELEEAQRILARASARSLVVIDELGRGTSTFDGMAIAEAILDCLIGQVGCYALYSTHYTQITEQFRACEAVRMMKMGYEEAEGAVAFTYQLVDGVAEKSFACNVARMVGIPEAVIRKARQRSEKMHGEIHRKKVIRQACRMAGLCLNPSAEKFS